MDLHVAQIGEEAVDQLKISGLHPEIIKLLGKLRFRFSYTQNVLDHSIEVATLCSMLASELGLEPNVAKRAGLLHDIGKSIEGEYEGSHALIGADFIRRYGETTIVVNAVAAHHAEVKTGNDLRRPGDSGRRHLRLAPRSARRVHDFLHRAARPARETRDDHARRAAGLRNPGGPRGPRGRGNPAW